MRELCDMRSGLYEGYDTPQFAAAELESSEELQTANAGSVGRPAQTLFPPNRGYRYSNTNYILLGLIIESLTKDSVADQIRKRLIEPFGLRETSFPKRSHARTVDCAVTASTHTEIGRTSATRCRSRSCGRPAR